MNHSKDRKPSRPDIQDILSRMKSRFINEGDSDNDDRVKEENNMVTTSVVENIKPDIPVEKSPDDEIAELMLKLNGQEDEELVASIKSTKKIYENQVEVDSTSSITINCEETEQEKPRIILTLRPNENKPDTYVSSSNLTEYNSTSPKEKQQDNEVKTPIKPEVVPLKRSARRSNINSNQTVLNSAIARKEKKFNVEEKVTKRLPKRKVKKKNPVEVTNEVFHVIEPEDLNLDIIYDVENTLEPDEETITDQKKKKKKVFRGGRYNIFKKKSLQKIVPKKVIYNQLNSDSTHFVVNWSETNSERHSASVCSDLGTLVSSDRNDQDYIDTSSVSNIDVEDKSKSAILDNIQDKAISLCLCSHKIDVFLFDEGTITCKAEDCIDGNLIPCKKLALHFNDSGNMPMVRANIALPFMTFCLCHFKRFILHHSCPRCGRFCSDGIFMMCKNKHFSHIGCHQKDKGCLHCGVTDVYDVELKRHVVKQKKEKYSTPSDITVEIGNIKLSTIGCPPQINKAELSKYLKQLKDEIANPKRTMYSVLGLYQACETNNVKKVISIIGAECNLLFKFSKIFNRTALHVACLNGNLMIIYLLLQAGVNPNVVDDKMKSPLRMAAKSGHSFAVQYLLDFNASPEIKDLQGMTTLHLAAKNGHIDCCKVLLKKRPSMINWKDKGGWTPLVWACENSHIEIVKYFISLKPKTNIRDEENNVALHWAAVSGCFEVVKCLVEYDPQVNVANDAGDTALHIAVRKNALDIVLFLLKNGATASYKNKKQKRPIDCCFLNTKCYNLLKSFMSGKQKKSISGKRSVNSKYTEPKLKIAQLPIVFKTTSVLVSEDISHGCEDVPIRCVNEIDDELPIEFTYIKENCYDVGNHVDSAMSHIASCNCEGACNTSNCKCVQANGACLYNENGRLNSNFDFFNPSVILYECNLRCRCHKQQCGNRVIQKGIKINLELFKHKDMGWGVRTRQTIPRGTFVCEYVGEIITDQKANKLKEDSYLFNLENPGSTQLYCIDAYNYSNISRFINHSCDPNLMSVRSFINHHDKRFPRIAFFAVQDIATNEQLYYDYGTTFWKIKSGLFTCRCGTSNCNFSSETIKCHQIDSKNVNEKKTPVQIQSKKPIVKPRTVQLSKRNGLKTNKIVLNKSIQEHTRMSSSGCSSLVTTKQNNQKKNSNPLNAKSMPKNGLKAQNKNGAKCSKPLSDSQSKKIPEIKMIQNKLKNVMVKKRVDEKVLKSNMSTTTGEKLFISKDKIPESIRITDNEVVTTYLIKPKLLNPKKKMKTDDGTVENGTMLKAVGYQNNGSINLLDASNGDQDTVEVLNNSNQLIDLIKKELADEESESKLNMSNGESSCTFEEKYVKVKPGKALDIKTSFQKEHFLNSNNSKWSSIESFSEILLNE